jgi:hypothetical protein
MKSLLFILFFVLIVVGCAEKKKNKHMNLVKMDSLKVDSVKAKAIIVKKDSTFSTTCTYKGLSDSFDFRVKRTIISKFDTNYNDYHNSNRIRISVINKNTHTVIDQNIWDIKDGYLWEKNFTDPENARSFITGKNKNKDVRDSYYGDFVVGDFNFDEKEDFALVDNLPADAGPSYHFYLQAENKKFVLDKFLTDSLPVFPAKIDKKHKRLVAYGNWAMVVVSQSKDSTKKWFRYKYDYPRF